ncbi:hypothetical protein RvY_05299 [Ramazzottius varieornatus]|uniref:Pre-mRNA-splicing factor 18 n=1 Tax=Ramazzottius varieornatus TaxID=947166 RepID=A0A1D1UY90_RAMVA|nr:hypothetical protein RvY_05299 [Ramazzottius varieornatus]
MDVLKAEILRKRKALESADVGKNDVTGGKKYFRRGETVAQATTISEPRKTSLEHSDGNVSPRIEPSTDPSNTKQRDGSRRSHSEDGDDVKLPRKEVVRRLRERNEPIWIFGENEEESARRLKVLEIHEPEANIGFRNDLKLAMDKIDEEYMNELAKGQTDSSKAALDIKINEDGTTLQTIRDLVEQASKGETVSPREVVFRYMKFVLRRWAEELNKRSMEEKLSSKGKLERGTYVQTEDYLKSLFQKLKNKSLQDDILGNLFRIIVHSLDRDYVRANEVFLQMAIGNAPWPIGVTAVGIHSRPGREKVFTQMIAHVLNDETQRKYIQAFKRLMTKMQTLYPTDPSRSVEYHASTIG